MVSQEHILIIKHGALGDIILASGHIKAIRNHHPNAHITCLTGSSYVSLIKQCGWIDEVWADPKAKSSDIKGWLSISRLLRSRRFTHVYDLQTSSRSTFYWWFLRFPKPFFSGIARFASHPQRGAARHTMHAVAQLNDQLAIAGIHTDGAPDMSWLSADISRFNLPERYALIVAGGSAHRLEKRWSAESYGALAQALVASGITPILIGGNAESDVLNAIQTAVPESINLCNNTSLAELASLARGARWAIGNDTGPLHLIASTSCPSTVIFSHASDPAKSAPVGSHVRLLRAADLSTLSLTDVLATAPFAL